MPKWQLMTLPGIASRSAERPTGSLLLQLETFRLFESCGLRFDSCRKAISLQKRKCPTEEALSFYNEPLRIKPRTSAQKLSQMLIEYITTELQERRDDDEVSYPSGAAA